MARTKMTGLGLRLRQAREAKHMTQPELAAQLDVGERTIRRWEQEDQAPNSNMLARIGRVLEREVGYFVGASTPRPVTAGAAPVDRAAIAIDHVEVSDQVTLRPISQDRWVSEPVAKADYGVDPARLRDTTWRGDAMGDTIRPGERVLLAVHAGEPIVDGTVYLIRAPAGLAVRRIRIMGDQIQLSADNEATPVQVMAIDSFREHYELLAFVLESARMH